MNKFSSKKLTTIAMLIALQIVLTRFGSIQLPTVRIGIGFIPIVIVALFYGPLAAAGANAIADIIGATLFPSGAFFFGFTISAFLTGYIYGLFLKEKPVTLLRAIVCSVIISIGIHLFLNTYWLTIITGKGWIAMLPGRLFKTVVMIPLEVSVILFIDRMKYFKTHFQYEE